MTLEMNSSIHDISLRICHIFLDDIAQYFKSLHVKAVSDTSVDPRYKLRHLQTLLKPSITKSLAIYNACVRSDDTLARELAALKTAVIATKPGGRPMPDFRMEDFFQDWMLECAREIYQRVEIFHDSNRKNLKTNLEAIITTTFFLGFDQVCECTDSEDEEDDHEISHEPYDEGDEPCTQADVPEYCDNGEEDSMPSEEFTDGPDDDDVVSSDSLRS